MSFGFLPSLSGLDPVVARVIAGAVAALLLAALLGLRRLVRRRHRDMLASEGTEVLELPFGVLSRTTVVFFIGVALFFGLKLLDVPESVGTWLEKGITIVVFWQAGIWISAAFLAWLDRKRRHSLDHDRSMVGSISIIGIVVRALIWTLVVLLTLDNLGVDITTLIAGLGIGGIAVALALQNILGDLFASLAIALDQPFVVGDALLVGDVLGTVESIGIKSTRLRSLGGEQVIVSNADLLSSRVRNFGRMSERRVAFVLNLTYSTPVDLLEAAPGVIRTIVQAQPDTRFDRCHFASYGAHSLDFECVYFVLSADYTRHMDVLQAINLAIFREFARLGIEFAYPTRTVHLAAPNERGRQPGP